MFVSFLKNVKEAIKFFIISSQPISCHWSLSITPEIIKKLLLFGCFAGGRESNQWHRMGSVSYIGYYFGHIRKVRPETRDLRTIL